MKYYLQHNMARFSSCRFVTGLYHDDADPAAYAHNLYQYTTSNSYKLGTLISESYAPTTVAVSRQQGANAYKGSIPANQASYHENYELADGYDNGEFVEKKNGNDCCHKCENIFIQVVSAAHNKHEDKHIALFAHTESILPTSLSRTSYLIDC